MMITRRKFLRTTALASAGAFAAQQIAFAAEKIELKLASTARQVFDNLPLYVAEHGGTFEKYGLNVELSHFGGGGGEVVRAVASGASDIGMVGTTAAILAIGTGQKLKVISGFTAPSYGVIYVVQANSPFQSIADLAGKTVGFSRPGSVSHTALIAALKANGVMDKVTIIPTGSPGDSLAALKTGRIQASWFNMIDAYALVAKKEIRILFGASKYLTEYEQGAFIATEDYLAENEEKARSFLAAIADAIKFTVQNPEQAAKLGASELGATEEDIVATIKDAPKNWWSIGAPNPKDIAGSLAEAASTGSLKGNPTYEEIVDKRFLP